MVWCHCCRVGENGQPTRYVWWGGKGFAMVLGSDSQLCISNPDMHVYVYPFLSCSCSCSCCSEAHTYGRRVQNQVDRNRNRKWNDLETGTGRESCIAKEGDVAAATGATATAAAVLASAAAVTAASVVSVLTSFQVGSDAEGRPQFECTRSLVKLERVEHQSITFELLLLHRLCILHHPCSLVCSCPNDSCPYAAPPTHRQQLWTLTSDESSPPHRFRPDLPSGSRSTSPPGPASTREFLKRWRASSRLSVGCPQRRGRDSPRPHGPSLLGWKPCRTSWRYGKSLPFPASYVPPF